MQKIWEKRPLAYLKRAIRKMALLNLSNAYLGFGDHPLLDHTELHIEPNERVCLVGRNGAGKSTLMKVLAEEIQLDDGKLTLEKDIVVTRLEQQNFRIFKHSLNIIMVGNLRIAFKIH